MQSIPGVESCHVHRPGTEVPGQTRNRYVVELRTADAEYGGLVLKLNDRSAFEPFEAAVHNFVSSIAMRLENLAYQAGLEERVAAQTRRLEKALQEKELLLREVHHRVKNNLNMVISLLRLQFADFPDEHVQQAMYDSITRVQSMSLVHRLLYQAETQNSIDFSSFVERFVDQLAGSYEVGADVRIIPEIGDVSVGMETAVPVSIIINELVTNALKHAFPSGRSGTIRIRAQASSPGEVEVSVEDDGSGFPPEVEVERPESLGMQLVHGLTEQIGGRIRFTTNGGTTVAVSFPVAAAEHKAQ